MQRRAADQRGASSLGAGVESPRLESEPFFLLQTYLDLFFLFIPLFLNGDGRIKKICLGRKALKAIPLNPLQWASIMSLVIKGSTSDEGASRAADIVTCGS